MARIRANRNYKSSIFELIFQGKKELLELYNAINGTTYQNPEDLEINTLENALYISMKNDLSFVLDLRLNLYEHQSTINPNMPLRDLLYVSNIYSGMIDERKIYNKKLIRIPTPQFIVFYNGVEDQPERQELKLSNAYTVKGEKIALELKVLVLNVNLGKNEALMDACKSLKDYAIYVDKVRQYRKRMSLEDAIDQAAEECIEEGVMTEFLNRNRKKVKELSILEYTAEQAIAYSWEDGREEGREEGARRKLYEQIEKKLVKGKTAEEIADDLEEEIGVISKMIEEIKKQK